MRLARGVEIIAQSPSRLWHKVQCKSEASLRRSGVTLPRGLHSSESDARRIGVLGWVVLLLRAEGRRGVRGRGRVEVEGLSTGATDEARDREGEAVVDGGKGCVDDTRDQPNNDVRMALEDGPGGDDSCMGDSSSAGLSGPLEVGSSPTDAITDRRAWT